ncbi:MAG: hypothetical protein ACR2QK_14505 [Acidimicrobiales bacterium]
MSTFGIRLNTVLLGPVVAAVAVLVVMFFATAASAHDPIFLTEDQTTPETGPFMPDGTISFAVYGTLVESGDTRGMEFDLRDGDDLYLSLLIPDLEPEVSLADDQLPTMSLIEPDGSTREISPAMRSPFADPFSGTNYVTLFETVEPAAGGRHQVVVTGDSPTRFVVAVGTREEFFTPTERSGEKPTSFPAIAEPLNEWYSTAADGTVTAAADDGEDVDIDVEMVEEELAKLDADGTPPEPDGSDESEDAGSTGSAEDEAAAPAALDGSTEGGDGGSTTTWVAPLAVALAAVGGAGFYLNRRRSSEPA